jgi:hypothetical protein
MRCCSWVLRLQHIRFNREGAKAQGRIFHFGIGGFEYIFAILSCKITTHADVQKKSRLILAYIFYCNWLILRCDIRSFFIPDAYPAFHADVICKGNGYHIV